jgi:hypothetical protein
MRFMASTPFVTSESRIQFDFTRRHEPRLPILHAGQRRGADHEYWDDLPKHYAQVGRWWQVPPPC